MKAGISVWVGSVTPDGFLVGRYSRFGGSLKFPLRLRQSNSDKHESNISNPCGALKLDFSLFLRGIGVLAAC